MNRSLLKIVDFNDASTLATKFRRRRFSFFLSLVAPLPKPLTILDIGGEPRFWEVMGLAENKNYQIILLNLYPAKIMCSNFRSIVGDATDLQIFGDKSFEFVFSNSVIEHLGSYSKQKQMANEIQRIAKRYFIQTPNKNFPLEPHFLIPFFQFFPLNLQVFLIQRFNLGWYKKIPNKQKARQFITSYRLLSECEIRKLFPQSKLYKERILGIIKSFVAYLT